MTSADITKTLARSHWKYFKHICVPRCCLAGSEADLLVLQPSGWLEEVEIKISVADFKREFETKADKHRRLEFGIAKYVHKTHDNFAFDPENPLHEPILPDEKNVTGYYDWGAAEPHLIRRFWFAVPSEIYEKVKDLVPDYAGLLVLEKGRWRTEVKVAKPAPNLKRSRKLTEAEQLKLIRLGYLRYWDVATADLAKDEEVVSANAAS